MTNFPILDLVVGIIFIYFLLSIISNSILEVIITATNVRSKILEEWFRTIFDKPVTRDGTKPLGEEIMDHLVVGGLSKKGKSPSYVDAKNFSTALLEKITYDPENPKSIANDLRGIVTALEKTNGIPDELKRTFIGYAVEANQNYQAMAVKTAGTIDMFKSKIENWYDTSTQRLSGTLKRRYTRRITFILSVIITIGMNVDTIMLSQYLYNNPEARAKLAAQAYTAAKDSTIVEKIGKINNDTTTQNANLAQMQKDLSSRIEDIKKASAQLESTLPLGWNKAECLSFQSAPLKYSLTRLPGWILTIFAIMMGSPFWFDILNKIANLRGTGPKPETK